MSHLYLGTVLSVHVLIPPSFCLTFTTFIIIIIFIFISFIYDIHLYVPETDHVPRGYTVAATLSFYYKYCVWCIIFIIIIIIIIPLRPRSHVPVFGRPAC